ncbi:MAG TPA: pyridoxal phosphate-dependent aminotransferase [Thermoanaerobaculia bacterium]|nr:pyridoxal phosphate-dependent aminotransferase [Thermoanaerobaculia bacterium]
MTLSRALYMEWAKGRPVPAIDLAGSNLLACSLSDLPGARESLDLAGDSPEGYGPLLEAIAARHGVGPDRVALAGGCAGANFLACAALLDTGDEVLVERPAYDPLPAAARMLGASVRFFDRRFEDGWALDPDRMAAALTPRTRLVIVSSPHNPTGTVASGEALTALGRLAERGGFHILVDEVYRDCVVSNRPAPAATLSPAFISSSSLTKAYGLASLRCGWTLASPDVTQRIRRARDVVDGNGPAPVERLAALAFANLDSLAARAHALIEANGRLVGAFLARRADLECVPSSATIAFPRFRGGRDASPFVERLFRDHGVAVVSGSFFDAARHFRVSFGGATEKLHRGLAAIASCLDASPPNPGA